MRTIIPGQQPLRLIAARRSICASNGNSSEAGFVLVLSMSPCCAAFFIIRAEIRFQVLRSEQSRNYPRQTALGEPIKIAKGKYLVRFRRGAQHNIGSLQVTKRDLQEFCFTVHADPAQLTDVFYQVVRNLLICRRAGLFLKGEIRIH
jgi:hypothetical protein